MEKQVKKDGIRKEEFDREWSAATGRLICSGANLAGILLTTTYGDKRRTK